MTETERAFARLEAALSGLERLLSEAGLPVEDARAEELEVERDRLASEVARLTREAEEDARLRDEAARTVRAALGELKGVVATTGASTGAEESERG